MGVRPVGLKSQLVYCALSHYNRLKMELDKGPYRETRQLIRSLYLANAPGRRSVPMVSAPWRDATHPPDSRPQPAPFSVTPTGPTVQPPPWAVPPGYAMPVPPRIDSLQYEFSINACHRLEAVLVPPRVIGPHAEPCGRPHDAVHS